MSHLKAAARLTLMEYFKKTSLNGFRLLYYIRRKRYQRLLWFLFIAVGILFACYVVLNTLLEFLADPTVADRSALGVNIEDVPFPAVAVCSANKVSRRAIEQYAALLAAHSNISVEGWLLKLQLLGGYYDAMSVPADVATSLQTELAERWPADVRSQLLQLAPPCQRQLLSCRLAGVLQNCTQLFRLMATASGCCCVFNYKPQRIYRHKVNGEYGGLQLLLNASTADDFRLTGTHRNPGYAVHIFAPDGSLPNEQLSGTRSLHIAAGEAAAAELLVVVQEAAPELRKYAPYRRGCYFAEDGELSQASCLSKCQLSIFLSDCKCQPFAYASRQQQVVNCSLKHMGCVQRNTVNWSPALPECRRCMPLCNEYIYEFKKHRRPLNNFNGKASYRTVERRSELTIYFRSMYMPRFRQYELYNWYQILSNIGGVIGICIGCSLISGVEILYFFVYRLWINLRNLRVENAE